MCIQRCTRSDAAMQCEILGEALITSLGRHVQIVRTYVLYVPNEVRVEKLLMDLESRRSYYLITTESFYGTHF